MGKNGTTAIVKPSTRSLVLNGLSIVVGSWGLSHITRLVLPASLAGASHKQFLTNISVVATLISNACNISNYFVQRCTGSSSLSAVSNFVSRDVVLPIALVLETVVPLVYWPLRLFAMHLIMQEIPDGTSPIPVPVDVSVHLLPFVFLFSDHFLSGTGRKFKISNGQAWFLVTFLGLTYYKWLEFLIDPSTGAKYPYPFLDAPEPYKTVIFVCVSSVAWLFYILYQTFPPKPSAAATTKKE